MCADIDKAENQTAGCDDHCSTGAVQASRLGWGSRSWLRSWSSWWRSVTQKAAAEAAKKAAEAKKVKCMNTCKTLKCFLPQCRKVPEGAELVWSFRGSGYHNQGIIMIGNDESRKYFKCYGPPGRCDRWGEAMYSFPRSLRREMDKCTYKVYVTKVYVKTPGVGSDYLSECGKCFDK